MFSHNRTFWTLEVPFEQSVTRFVQMVDQARREGWEGNASDLYTNAGFCFARLRKPGAELEIFQQRRERPGSLDSGGKTPAMLVVYYRNPFSQAEIEAAIETLFAEDASPDRLWFFENSFNSSQRKKFEELLQKAPISGAQPAIRLAESLLSRGDTNGAIRMLLQAKAMACGARDPAAVRSGIDELAKKISPRETLKLTITPELCRELKFIETPVRGEPVTLDRRMGQPLWFFGEDENGLVMGAYTLHPPRGGVRPWVFTSAHESSWSSSSSSFPANAATNNQSVRIGTNEVRIRAAVSTNRTNDVRYTVGGL